MYVRRAAVLVTALASLLPFGPAAHAAEASIMIRFSPSFYRPVAGGYIAGSLCSAVATPGTDTQVAVAIELHCDINGFGDSSAAPGGATAVHLLVATPAPIQICATAEAAFLETAEGSSSITTVSTPEPVCAILFSG